MAGRGGRTSATRIGNGGWGGPAKGAGTGKREAFEVGNSVGGAGKTGETIARKQTDAERLEILRDELFRLGTAAISETARVRAIEAFWNRVEGLPVARQQITGPDGGPLQSVNLATTDPVEAARIYQRMMKG